MDFIKLSLGAIGLAVICAPCVCVRNVVCDRTGYVMTVSDELEYLQVHLYGCGLSSKEQVYPSNIDAQRQSGPNGLRSRSWREVWIDPWGSEYQYRCEYPYQSFELWTYGADGLPGGFGDDRDVHISSECELGGPRYPTTEPPWWPPEELIPR